VMKQLIRIRWFWLAVLTLIGIAVGLLHSASSPQTCVRPGTKEAHWARNPRPTSAERRRSGILVDSRR
jgi:hypothetical protein